MRSPGIGWSPGITPSPNITRNPGITPSRSTTRSLVICQRPGIPRSPGIPARTCPRPTSTPRTSPRTMLRPPRTSPVPASQPPANWTATNWTATGKRQTRMIRAGPTGSGTGSRAVGGRPWCSPPGRPRRLGPAGSGRTRLPVLYSPPGPPRRAGWRAAGHRAQISAALAAVALLVGAVTAWAAFGGHQGAAPGPVSLAARPPAGQAEPDRAAPPPCIPLGPRPLPAGPAAGRRHGRGDDGARAEPGPGRRPGRRLPGQLLHGHQRTRLPAVRAVAGPSPARTAVRGRLRPGVRDDQRYRRQHRGDLAHRAGRGGHSDVHQRAAGGPGGGRYRLHLLGHHPLPANTRRHPAHSRQPPG